MPDEDDSRDQVRFTWKDYLALFIAFVQTIALPLIVLIVILVAILGLSAVLR